MTDPSLRELSDDELAVRAQAGDAPSFDELVSRLRAPLARFLGRQLPGSADTDDAVQETFLRAFRSIDKYDPQRRFATWLFAIGKNVSATQRDQRRQVEAYVDASADHAADGVTAGPIGVNAREAESRAECTKLWQTAQRVLSSDAYRAMWLRYVQDLSVREVARELGRSTIATKVMLFRARNRLLEEEGSP